MDKLMQDSAQAGAWSRESFERELWSEFSADAFHTSGLAAYEAGCGKRRRAWADRLAQIIEAEVIPRLMLAHRPRQRDHRAQRPAMQKPSAAQVDQLALAALATDPKAAAALVDQLVRNGLPVEMAFLSLIAPAARRLGQHWESDTCAFTEVTLGLWRLQQIVADLSPAFQLEAKVLPTPRAILVSAVPGSQHTFGASLVAEFFSRAGWAVTAEAGATDALLCDRAASDWYDAIGLSIGSESLVKGAAALVSRLRRASHNPLVTILVGGPVCLSHPEVVALIGADGIASDAREAVEQAEKLVALRQGEAIAGRSLAA